MKISAFFLLLFLPELCFAQLNVKAYVKFHKISLNGDTLKLTPTLLEVDVNPLSEMIQINEVKGIKYGFRLEILESNILDKKSYITRFVFFEKVNDEMDWVPFFDLTNEDPKILLASDTVNLEHKYHNSIGNQKHGGTYIEYDIDYQWK